MTREQVLAMSPRELDVAVLRNIMTENWTKGIYSDIEYETAPHYSTDISAAWELLEQPEVMDRYQIGVYPTSFGKWIARPFMPGGKDCTVQDETAPLAICKCVLLAVMGI